MSEFFGVDAPIYICLSDSRIRIVDRNCKTFETVVGEAHIFDLETQDKISGDDLEEYIGREVLVTFDPSVNRLNAILES